MKIYFSIRLKPISDALFNYDTSSINKIFRSLRPPGPGPFYILAVVSIPCAGRRLRPGRPAPQRPPPAYCSG